MVKMVMNSQKQGQGSNGGKIDIDKTKINEVKIEITLPQEEKFKDFLGKVSYKKEEFEWKGNNINRIKIRVNGGKNGGIITGEEITNFITPLLNNNNMILEIYKIETENNKKGVKILLWLRRVKVNEEVESERLISFFSLFSLLRKYAWGKGVITEKDKGKWEIKLSFPIVVYRF